MLPAASLVNNCWAGMRGAGGGKTLNACHPVEKNVLVASYSEREPKTSHLGGKKVTFGTELLLRANQSQVCVKVLQASTSTLGFHFRLMTECTLLQFKAYPTPTHQVVA